MPETRKPIVVAVVIGAVLLLVFGLGVGLGGRGAAGSSAWLDRLGGLGAAGDLDLADVTAEGCTLEAGAVLFAPEQRCVVRVAARGGGFSLASPVRRAALVNAGLAVELTLQVEERAISRTVEPGESVDVTFGPDGGHLDLTCDAPLVDTRCIVRLEPAG